MSDSQRGQVTRKIWNPGSRRSSLAPASTVCGQTASSPVSSERLMACRPNADLVSTHSTPLHCLLPPNPSSLPPADLTKPHRLSSRKSFSTQALPLQPTPKPSLLYGLLSPPSPPACCQIDRVSGWLPALLCAPRGSHGLVTIRAHTY